jgi:hypothetical protein
MTGLSTGNYHSKGHYLVWAGSQFQVWRMQTGIWNGLTYSLRKWGFAPGPSLVEIRWLCPQLHQQGNALCSEGGAAECTSQELYKRSERLKVQESLLFYSILKLVQFQTKSHHAPQLQLTRLHSWDIDDSCGMGLLSCYHAMLWTDICIWCTWKTPSSNHCWCTNYPVWHGSCICFQCLQSCHTQQSMKSHLQWNHHHCKPHEPHFPGQRPRF